MFCVRVLWLVLIHTCRRLLPSRLSGQAHNIIASRFAQRGREPSFDIARQNMDGVKIEFSDMLVEDENNAAVSYLDFTLHWHRCSPQLCAVLMMPFKLHRPLRCAQTDQYSGTCTPCRHALG